MDIYSKEAKLVEVNYLKNPFKKDSDIEKEIDRGEKYNPYDYFTRKSISWEREEEVRVIINKTGLLTIPSDAATGIYFGLRMSDEDKKLIHDSLTNRNIKYYQMKLKENSYELEVEEV